MRNQLTIRSSTIPEVVYAADGTLDGHDFSMRAWAGHRVTLDFGLASVSLSPAAAAELVAHIQKALEVQAGALECELVKDAVLTDREMSYQNFARSEFDKLERLVLKLIIPELGGRDCPEAQDIRRHLEQVRSFSGNFCWKHRAVGDFYDAKEVRHA